LRARLLGAGNFSITSMSAECCRGFQAFDASVSSMIRGTVVLEFHKIDVFGRSRQLPLCAATSRASGGYASASTGLSHLSLRSWTAAISASTS